MMNHDLALAICGAGDGPFIDKLTSQAWDSVRHISNVWEGGEQIESMIKETYKEYGSIFQAGSCPHAELIYGIKIRGASRLYHATGPIVNEVSYASSGAGYYLADFLTSRMRGDGWLTVRQSVILAAYILFQAKEHVDGCGGDSHIAVLRESESSGMVDHNLIKHLTEYLKLADSYTGEILLSASDFAVPHEEFSKTLADSVEALTFSRTHAIKKFKDDELFNLRYLLTGDKMITDDLGLPLTAKPSDSQRSEDQQ